MTNQLIEHSVVPTSRFHPRRLLAAAIRRTPGLRSSALLELARRDFELRFLEEGLGPIRLSAADDPARQLNLYDQREALFRALVAEAIRMGLIERARNIVDVGAANGDSSLAWAGLIGGTVYAIDPSAANIAFIEGFARRHGIANLVAMTAAVGEREGVIYPLDDITHTSFSDLPLTSYGKKHPVNATTFDKLSDTGVIANLGFLHLDVEGMELATLRGSTRLLARDRPVVAFESHLTIDDTPAIFALLSAAGYDVFMINEVTSGGRPDCVNFLAFPAKLDVAERARLDRVIPVQPYFKGAIGPNLLPV